METHILSNPNPKALNESLKQWEKLNWKAQGGLVYGLVGDISAYSILLVRTAKKTVKKRFIPPTLQEVKDYIAEKKYGVDAEAWLAHYESKDWKKGRGKITDWKAAVRTWQYSTNGDKQPLNIPSKPWKEPEASETTSPEKAREMLEKNEKENAKIAAFKSVGQMPDE